MVSTAPGGSIYSTPEYLDGLCSATGGSFRVLGAERGGELLDSPAFMIERAIRRSNQVLRAAAQSMLRRAHGSF